MGALNFDSQCIRFVTIVHFIGKIDIVAVVVGFVLNCKFCYKKCCLKGTKLPQNTVISLGVTRVARYPIFYVSPVFQPQSPASRNEATREMKSPVFGH